MMRCVIYPFLIGDPGLHLHYTYAWMCIYMEHSASEELASVEHWKEN